jgi:hypothetical protein
VILASLNPNLTLQDLERLGRIRIETLEAMGDTWIAGVNRQEPEHRAEYMSMTLPILLQLYSLMMIW